ncbi:MAG: metalloregulator ArsR/SmtB family transcription factor [Aeromicrobium sp.]
MATDQLSRVFSALSDPTRRDILLRLGGGPVTVTELAEPFPISLPAVSRHLKVLEQAGLISRDRKAQWRTSTLRAEQLKEATTWMEHLSSLWDERFDRLDEHLAALQRHIETTTTEDKDKNDD